MGQFDDMPDAVSEAMRLIAHHVDEVRDVRRGLADSVPFAEETTLKIARITVLCQLLGTIRLSLEQVSAVERMTRGCRKRLEEADAEVPRVELVFTSLESRMTRRRADAEEADT